MRRHLAQGRGPRLLPRAGWLLLFDAEQARTWPSSCGLTQIFPGELAPDQRKKIPAKVTRLLRLLRAHGIVEKIEGTHRNRVTLAGRRLIATAVAAGAAPLSLLKQSA